MEHPNAQKSSAELEREVSEQRNRVEARIGEIKDRLSPGQLVDELLSYTKDGGSKFASNLGQQVTANPIPAALIGVGIVWLMNSDMNGGTDQVSMPRYREEWDEYPYARVSAGRLRRISHKADEAGKWWSEFETDSAARYRAQADALGNRAGYFTDETGKKFSGFIDDAGNRVRQFQDEAGNTLDDALGWASHSWSDLQSKVGRQMHGLTSAASSAVTGTRQLGSNLGDTVQTGADQLTRQISSLFEQQPLIAGALAFAAGAALGASLPHTQEEDQLVGEEADRVRRKAGEAAGSLYKKGKEQAADLYDEVTDKAGQLYADTKERASDLATTPGGVSISRH
jgi:hypothetical protein